MSQTRKVLSFDTDAKEDSFPGLKATILMLPVWPLNSSLFYICLSIAKTRMIVSLPPAIRCDPVLFQLIEFIACYPLFRVELCTDSQR